MNLVFTFRVHFAGINPLEWFSKAVSARSNNNYHGDTGILMFLLSSFN